MKKYNHFGSSDSYIDFQFLSDILSAENELSTNYNMIVDMMNGKIITNTYMLSLSLT